MTAAKMREWRQKQRERGLCAHCVRPVCAESGWMCEGHRLYFLERKRSPEGKAKHRKYLKRKILERAARDRGEPVAANR